MSTDMPRGRSAGSAGESRRGFGPGELVAREGEVLVAGWEPDLPEGDTLQRRALLANARRVAHDATTGGFPFTQDDEVTMGTTMASGSFANWVVVMQPVTDGAALAARARSFFGADFSIVVSPWPMPDMSEHGGKRIGHPPLMVRLPGGSVPEAPPGLEIHEVTDAAGIASFEAALIDGYPVDGIEDRQVGCVVRPGMLEASEWGRTRRFVGVVQGAPVATAAVFLHGDSAEIDYVATLPSARGHGLGAALTWTATLADPAATAMLIASDDGRPVYERMGYVAVERWTVWGLQQS